MKKALLIAIAMMPIMLTVSAQNGNGYTKKQADNMVLNTLLISDLESSDVYSLGTLISKNDTIWHFDGSFIKSPYNMAWAYFVDDCPYANWVHPCRYIFVNATNGNYQMVYSELPTENFNFTPLSLFTRPTPISCNYDVCDTPMVKSAQDNPHLYAVLICGSENILGTNEYRFKNDLSAIYSTLINVYGYMKEHIFVIFNDGHSDYGNDLDGDGFADIDFGAYKSNIRMVFSDLAGNSNHFPNIPALEESDQLFIFTDDHGGSYSYPGNPLDDQEYMIIRSSSGIHSNLYFSSEMAEDLQDINCAQMIIVMQQCHSGGFVSHLADVSNVNCRNRIILTSTDEEHSSWSESILTGNMYCEFAYYWVAAARGYYPGNTNPWDNSYATGSNPFLNYPGHNNFSDFSPDLNGDGYMQMEEIFYYTDALDRYSPNGFYYPNNNNPNQVTTEYPQQSINLGFHGNDHLLTLGGLAGHVSMSQSINNRTYLCGGNLTIDQGKTVILDTGSKFYISPNNSIIVQNNAVLTAKGLMRFGMNAGARVEQGGLLNIDGSHLAGWDNKQWQGVRVWGDSNAPQLPVHQGCLNVCNNALIEDAQVAIDLRNPFTNTSGGIVNATNSAFRNNTISLKIPAYSYTSPSSYESEFANCSFSIDNSYLGDGFSYHVYLENVKGIQFKGCQFQMNNTGSPAITNGSCGVYAYNSSPSFTEYNLSSTQPNSSVQKCTFNNFRKVALYVVGDLTSLNKLDVSNAEFTSNAKGILAKNLSQVSVVSSDFYIGSDDACSFGIILDNTPSFIIEGNAFSSANNTGSQTYGIHVRNSNAVNKIHNNTFNNLYCANLAEGQNWLGKRFLGLSYTCNSNSSNNFDFYVLCDPTRYSGIQISQGSNTAPARNSFSSTASYQFYNGGDYNIDYYYNSNCFGETPAPNRVYHITSQNTNALYDCSSNYSDGASHLSELEIMQREQVFYDAYSNYTAVKQLYDSRIDGGNTSSTIADVENAASSDMWRLRSQLLGNSPYLSQVVLMTVAERNDVFPVSVLTEILSANPDELKEDTLIDFLQYNELLPEYAISMLQQVATGTSYRTVMQQQMAEYKHEYTEAAYDIIRSILNDSIVNYSALRGWLSNLEDVNADRAIIATYMEEGDSISAFTLAGLLPQLYELEDDDLADHFGYVQLLTLCHNIKQSGRSVFSMTEEEKGFVEDVANTGYGVSKSMAETILDILGENSSADCPALSPAIGTKGGGTFEKGAEINKDLGLQIYLSPNPAANWITVDYILPDGYSEASLVITNAMGIEVANILLEGNRGSKVIDLTKAVSGVYGCYIQCGTFIKTEKIIVK